ncbi:MAG: hypothetical protein QFX34_00755 [Candidatus Verstraetearchaeota archaeon]|nr:hypothetical protein [Candidatus Verstraetearchaeota archaeon]
MRGQDAPFTNPRNRQTLLLYGDRNAARGLALKACIEKGRTGGRALYLQQRILAVNENALRSMVGSENVMLGIFESLGEVAIMISEIKPSIAVIDPVNGINEGYLSRRRLALDLFEMATAAARFQISLILLCDMTEWKGISTPRHYSLIRKFCDCELEVKDERKTISGEESEVAPG